MDGIKNHVHFFILCLLSKYCAVNICKVYKKALFISRKVFTLAVRFI